MVSSKQNRSIMVSEVEVPPDVPDKSSIPRSLLSPTLKLAFNRRSVSSPTEDDALEPKQDHDQRQDQMQEQLILLASINEQTTSLLQTLSQFQSQSQSQRQYQPKSEDRENEVFEQALILGQIVLVLASSLSHTVEGQAQVLVALANMGMTLVKQSDRTGNKRDLEEAGGLFERAVVVGKGGNAKKERKLGKHEDVDGSGEVLVRLEKLGGLLGERGFVV